MAIDRAEDGDAAEGEPTLPDRHAPEPLHDPVERVAEHTRYRASVENYGAAKDGWVQALPSLHAAWERHVEKYPERERATPRIQPDGSWADDGGRELNPEQNAEASKACEDIAEEGKEVVLPAMKRIEAADPDRHLAGLGLGGVYSAVLGILGSLQVDQPFRVGAVTAKGPCSG